MQGGLPWIPRFPHQKGRKITGSWIIHQSQPWVVNIYKTIYPMVRFIISYLCIYIYIYSSVFVGKHPIAIFLVSVRSENVARFINRCFMEVSFWYQVLITWGKLHESKNARVYHQEDSAQFSATSQWFLLGIFTKNHWRILEGSPLGRVTSGFRVVECWLLPLIWLSDIPHCLSLPIPPISFTPGRNPEKLSENRVPPFPMDDSHSPYNKIAI